MVISILSPPHRPQSKNNMIILKVNIIRGKCLVYRHLPLFFLCMFCVFFVQNMYAKIGKMFTSGLKNGVDITGVYTMFTPNSHHVYTKMVFFGTNVT